MRNCTAPAWIVCLVALAPSLTSAQQQGSLVSPHLTPLTIEEPRVFPYAGTIEARPLEPAYPQARSNSDGRLPKARRIQPPVNFRLASTEESLAAQNTKPPLRLAPRSEASRQPIPKPAAPTPGGALAAVAGSLSAVLGLFLVVVWCTRRFATAGAALLPKEAVELLGRAPLAARQQAQLVRIGNKLLLVAISPGGVEPLTEITEPTEVEHLTALCRRGQPGSLTAAFRQALTQLGSEPAPRGFVGASQPNERGAR